MAVMAGEEIQPSRSRRNQHSMTEVIWSNGTIKEDGRTLFFWLPTSTAGLRTKSRKRNALCGDAGRCSAEKWAQNANFARRANRIEPEAVDAINIASLVGREHDLTVVI